MSCAKRISEQSALAFNNALNVFAVPPTNVSVARSFFREFLPLSTISQEGPYLFRMYNDNLWADLARVYLYLELSIEKPDAQGVMQPIDAVADKDVGTCQSIGQTFVQQLKVGPTSPCMMHCREKTPLRSKCKTPNCTTAARCTPSKHT